MAKEQIIDPKARVTVFATDKSTYHTKGEPYTVGKMMAEKLIKAGKVTATLEAQKETAKSPEPAKLPEPTKA